MATVAYATLTDLDAYLPADVSPSDLERLLLRASEVIDDKVRAPFRVNPATQLPTDARVAEALRQAVCAQVEFWLDVGEDHDIEGLHNRQVQIGHLDVSAMPPELGPRAKRFLRSVGLLDIGSAGQDLELV